jgi:serine/threonine-protein kinase
MVAPGSGGVLRPGTVLLGKYEIVGLLGRGGFGLVYEAIHTGLRSRVALKLLNPDARQNPKTVARFRQEAWTSAQIASPHVVRVTDIDVLEDGTPFLVMEHLVGQDLEKEMRARRRLPPREAVDYVLQAASGVREAHVRGVIHRDLKTSNLFLVDDPAGRKVKVLDFGLSKMAEMGMTTTHALLGTPHYSSPEQMRSSKDVDARSDIWSLGVILYQLLSGRRPFDGSNPGELIKAIAVAEAPDLARVAPDVPAGLCQAVMKTLRKDPARRFQSTDELAAALAPYGPPGAYLSSPPSRRPSMPEPVLGPSSTFLESTKDTPPEQRKSRLRTGIALLAVMVLVTIAIGAMIGGRLLMPDPPSAAAPPQPEPQPVKAAPTPVNAQLAPLPSATTPSPAPTPTSAPVSETTEAATPTVRREPRSAPRRTSPPREPNLGF